MSRRLARAGTVILIVPLLGSASAQEAGSERTLDLQLRVVDLQLRISDLAGAATTTESNDEVEVALSADVLFAFDSARLTPKARGILADVARRIEKEGSGPVQIEGHTDSKGSGPYNSRLSLRRARAVHGELRRLVGGGGIGFEVRGFGETRPVAPNTRTDGSDNPQGRALNRRVEVRFPK
ncbi:MAG: OmpA family protein [Actinomycetota bacterium]